jgi:hypothetical protein
MGYSGGHKNLQASENLSALKDNKFLALPLMVIGEKHPHEAATAVSVIFCSVRLEI